MAEAHDNQSGPGRQPEVRLTENERELLRSNNGDTTTTSGMTPDSLQRERIRKKASRQPERFQDLFDDIPLLIKSGMLDRRTWSKEMGSILGEEDKNYASLGPGFADRFGEELGRIAAWLVLDEEIADRESVLGSLFYGFAMGVWRGENEKTSMNRWRPNSSDIWDDAWHSIARSLDYTARAWVDASAPVRDIAEEGKQQRVKQEAELNDRIRRALSQLGLTPPQWVVTTIQRDLEFRYVECVRSIRCPHINEGNAPPLSDLITPATVFENIWEQSLHKKHYLIRVFEDDIRRLEQLEWDDILGTHLVASLPDLPQISITNIAESLGSRKDRLPAVAKLCLYLTGEEKIEGATWSRESIIELEKQGANFTNWTVNITTYGRGLRGYLSRRLMGARTGHLGPQSNPLNYLPRDWEDILGEIDQ